MYSTVQDMWLSYKKAVLPANAGKIQIEETKKAFYGGAHASMFLLFNEDNKKLTDIEFFNLLKKLDAEIDTFVELVQIGDCDEPKLSS